MQPTSRKAIYVVLAAGLSFVVHVLLLLFADHIPVTAFGAHTHAPPEPRRITVRTIDIRERVFGRDEPVDPLTFPRRSADDVADALAASDRIRHVFETHELIAQPRPQLSLEGLGQNLVTPKPEPTAAPTPPSAPRPEIIEIDVADIPSDQLAEHRPVFEQVPRQQIEGVHVPSLFHSDRFEGGRGDRLGVGMRLGTAHSPPDLSSTLRRARDDDARADSPESPELGPLTRAPSPDDALADDARLDSTRTRTVAIDELLNVRMAVYHPPGEREGVFRIDVSPNPHSDRLRAIAKDVLFLIDRSGSISPAKLRVFKNAVTQALEYLNPRDRFNVVSFRVEPDSLFDAYMPVTPDNVAAAQAFVERLRRGGLTDVYAGLAPFVGDDQGTAQRPLTVFVFTDGESTVPDRLDNETLIREIIQKNRDQVSIYSASCGESNRFLLDLLAYSNRGVPLHEERLDRFEDRIVNYIGAHSDIIVADLQVTGTGRNVRELYPKKLPHLFRGQTLSIFGRFPQTAETIAVRITGRAAGGTATEFIFTGSIADAHRADQELLYDWIAQKAFYLVLQRIMTESPEVETELRALQRRYNLQIPYL